jgi:predicted nuclease of predicted toxin-antitoxin system
MKILIDECVPRRFKFSLARKGHDCQTVPEAGLAGKRNGELLNLAEGTFDLFVTLDKGLEFQQNLAGKAIAIIVIRAKSNRFVDVEQHAAECLEAIESIQPGQLIRIGR